MDEFIDDILEILSCPISGQIINKPLLMSDGITYEENCIQTWLKSKDTSPVTREIIEDFEGIEPLMLKNILALIQKKFPHKVLDQYDCDKYHEHAYNVTKIYDLLATNAKELLEYTKFNLAMLVTNISARDNLIQLDVTLFQHIIQNSIDIIKGTCKDNELWYKILRTIRLHDTYETKKKILFEYKFISTVDGEYDWVNNKDYIISLLNTTDSLLHKELLLYKNFDMDYFCDGLDGKKSECNYSGLCSGGLYRNYAPISHLYKLSPTYKQYCQKTTCKTCKSYFDKVTNTINIIESLALMPTDIILHIIKNTNIKNNMFFTILANKIITDSDDDEKLHAILTNNYNNNTNDYAIMFKFNSLVDNEILKTLSTTYGIDPKVFIIHTEYNIRSWIESAEYLLQHNMQKSFDIWYICFQKQKKQQLTLSNKMHIVTFYHNVYHNHFEKFLSWIIEKNTPYMDKTNFPFCISDDEDNNEDTPTCNNSNFFTLINHVDPSYITDTILLKIMLTGNDYPESLATVKKSLLAMVNDISNIKKHTLMTIIYYDLAQGADSDKELYDIIFSARPDCFVELIDFITINLVDSVDKSDVKYNIDDVYYLCKFYKCINSNELVGQFYHNIFKLVDAKFLDLTKLIDAASSSYIFKLNCIDNGSIQSSINEIIEFLTRHNSLTSDIIFDNITNFMSYANNDNCTTMIKAIRYDERFGDIKENIFKAIANNATLGQMDVYNMCNIIFSG